MVKNGIKQDNLIKMHELAKISGFRYSTIKFYSEIGILPYLQQDKRLVRRYDPSQAVKRLQEIRKLKDKGQSIREIKKHYGR